MKKCHLIYIVFFLLNISAISPKLSARSNNGCLSTNHNINIIFNHFHSNLLLYISGFLISLVLIWLASRLSTKKIRQEKADLEQLLNEKIKDIERKKEEIQNQSDKMREMYNILLENSKFKDGMTSMIVHDLKNPLNSILNVPANLPPEKQLLSIRQSAKQMFNLVMNILDVNKYQKSRMELELKDSSLFDIVFHALNQVYYLASQKNIALKMKIKKDWIVSVDVEIMARVFVNLLTNAIKYTPVNGNIRIEAFYGNSQDLYIRVIDSGPGIPKEKEILVFSEFGQVIAKKAGDVRSTGLGLTFCKMAVEAHGGKIGFESNSDGGTIFWFTIKSEKVKNSSQNKPNSIDQYHEGLNNEFLTAEDRIYLKGFLTILWKVEIYSISKLRWALNQIENRSEGLVIWKEKILDASYSNNEELYNELLNL